MRLSLEKKEEILVVNGVPARRYLGTTDAGEPVEALIVLVKATRGERPDRFDDELKRIRQAANFLRSRGPRGR